MEKRMTCCILALFFLLLCLPSCKASDRQTVEFWGMGTLVSVTLYGPEAACTEGFAQAQALMTELDGLWSLNHPDSDLSRLNRSESGITDADGRTVALVKQAIGLSELTGGAFDITLASLSALWKTCGEEDRLPTDAELSVLLDGVGTAALRAEGTEIGKPVGAAVDLGAIAKGAAAEQLATILRRIDGLSGGLISMGSCVTVFGSKPGGAPFRVSVRDPKNRNGTVGSLTLSDGQVLSVSGDYERFVTIGGKNYHHILDPHTGYPTDSGLSSVAVVASNGAVADALSTAFMVMGEDAAAAFYRAGKADFEAVFIRSDGSVVCTDRIDIK